MKKLLTILSLLTSSYSFSQVVVKVPQPNLSNYVTRPELLDSIKTEYAKPPGYWDGDTLKIYTETDSTLSDNSDTTLPTTKAVRAYVNNKPPLHYDLKFNYLLNGDTSFKADPAGWDQGIKHPGNTIYDGTQYIMTYSGYMLPYTDTTVYVGYVTSPDNKTWTKKGKLLSVPMEDPYLVYYQGTYYLYADDKSVYPFTGISLHTSTDLVTWTDQGTVLNKDTSNLYEKTDVSSPTVWVENGVFYLFYTARNQASNTASQQYAGAISVATSTDGIHFTKSYQNPLIEGTGTPIFAPQRGDIKWATNIFSDDIFKVEDKYYMTFHGYDSASNHFKTGIAISKDLYHWSDYLRSWVSRQTDVEDIGEVMVWWNGKEFLPRFTDSTNTSYITGTFGIKNDYNIGSKGFSTSGQVTFSKYANNNSTKFLTTDALGNLALSQIDTSNTFATKASSIDFVTDIPSLENYTGNAKTVIVADLQRGGIFNLVNSGTPDSGTVFKAYNSGYWLRQYNKGTGVNVDWFGNRNDISINQAINTAGVNGTINFTPAQTYTLDNTIYPLYGQILNGNGATLKRNNDTIVVLSSPVLSTDSSFTVNAIPSIWKTTSGVYQFFSDSTNTNQNVTTTKSVSIIGNTVKLGGTIGKSWPATTTYVRRSYSMIYAVNSNSNIKIKNITFDGNKANTSSNLSWLANTTILAKGYGDIDIDNCNFINIPNENIMGQGLRITKNNATNLNGSFVHLSTEANTLPVNKPTIISHNITQNTNLKQAITGHSEGVITNSFSPGNIIITNNWFLNGGTAGVFGYIQSDTDPADGAYRNVTIADNYAENCGKIFYSLSILPSLNRNGHILIQGNTFDNCGINDWTPYKDSIDKDVDTIMIGNNLLVGGTVWKIPVQMSDSLQRYILNNPTTTAQKAKLNITGSGTFGDTLSVGNIPQGTIGDSLVTTKNKLIKKVAYANLGFLPLTGGNMTGSVGFANNTFLLWRATDGTGVPVFKVDGANNINIGGHYLSNQLFYINNDYVFYTTGSDLERLRIRGGGNIIMGGSSDNGVDLLQINGTVNSLGNTITGKTEATTDSSNKLASTAFVKQIKATSGTSGLYTPTFTLTANLSDNNFHSATYSQSGNIVTGRISDTPVPSASGVVTLTFTLPVSTTNTTQGNVGSATLTFSGTTYTGLVSILNGTQAQLIFTTASGTQALDGVIMFQYSTQ